MHVLRPGLTNPHAQLGLGHQPNIAIPLIATQNKVLGFARMRQVRVRNDSCFLHPSFRRYRMACYGHYSTDNEDSSPYGAGPIKYDIVAVFSLFNIIINKRRLV